MSTKGAKRRKLNMESLKVVVALVSMFNVVENIQDDSTWTEKCFPPKNMCDLDTDTCIGPDTFKLGYFRECETFYQGPGTGKVMKLQRPRKFWIGIDDLYRYIFPVNFTYSIYRKQGSHHDWSTPELKPIKGCCGLTLSDRTCLLPKYQKDTSLIVVAPVATMVTDPHWYCLWGIEEYDSSVTFCDKKKDSEKRCVEFKDGFPYERSEFIPVSLTEMHLKADYCFFSAPTEITTRVLQDGDTYFSHEEYFPNSTTASNCNPESQNGENLNDMVKRHYSKSTKGVVCYYILLPSLSNEWQNTIKCNKVEDQTRYNFKDTPYFPAVLGAIICLLMVLMIYVVGYHRIRGAIRKEVEKSLPSTVITATTKYIDDEKTASNILESTDGCLDEIYFAMEYEIGQGAPKNPEEVLPKSVFIENPGYQWPSATEKTGIYCKKSDLLPYVRVAHDIN